MGKPDDIPQDVWDHAEVLAKEATRDAMRDPLMPYFVTVRPYIARAILAAKAKEHQAPSGWKWQMVPDYPSGQVAGPCICGSWPGGECFKCPPLSAPDMSGEA